MTIVFALSLQALLWTRWSAMHLPLARVGTRPGSSSGE
jgi:hypothetical protein